MQNQVVLGVVQARLSLLARVIELILQREGVGGGGVVGEIGENQGEYFAFACIEDAIATGVGKGRQRVKRCARCATCRHSVRQRNTLGGQWHTSGRVRVRVRRVKGLDPAELGDVVAHTEGRKPVGAGGEDILEQPCRSNGLTSHVVSSASDACALPRQSVLVHDPGLATQDCRPIVLEAHGAADFLGHGLDIGQTEAANVEGVIARPGVLDRDAIVCASDRVVDETARQNASDLDEAIIAAIACCESRRDGVACVRAGACGCELVKNRRTVGSEDSDACDVLHFVGRLSDGGVHGVAVPVQQSISEGSPCLFSRGKCFERDGLWVGRCGLRNFDSRAGRREKPAEQDIVFVTGLRAGQGIGTGRLANGVARVRIGHEGQNHPFTGIDTLVIGAQGRTARWACLAGVHRVTFDFVRIHTADDDADVRCTGPEHHEDVLSRRRTRKIEAGVHGGTGPETIRQGHRIIVLSESRSAIGVRNGCVQSQPDFGAGGCFLQIGGEDDSAA